MTARHRVFAAPWVSRLSERQRLAGITLLGIATVMVAVRYLKPGVSWFLPPCPFHTLTGLYCPGCGSTRMLYLIVHGHPLLAFHENAFAMLVLPLIIVKLASELAGKNLLSGLRDSRTLGLCIATVVILFTVARNLPWEPFRLLAPQDLQTVSSAATGDSLYRTIPLRLK